MELMTAQDAAKLLNLSYIQTRIYLGDPHDYEVCKNGKKRLLYTKERVEEVKRRHDAMIAERQEHRGTRKCYQCGARVQASDLTSGICSRCHAYKLVKNFVCHRDYIHGAVDYDRIQCIKDAIDRLTAQGYQTEQQDNHQVR